VVRLAELLKTAKASYDCGGNPFGEIQQLVNHCIRKLKNEAQARHQADVGGKSYSVFVGQRNRLSRPFLPDLFLDRPGKFNRGFKEIRDACNGKTHIIELSGDSQQNIRAVNSVLYTSVAAVAACFDIWKSGSRKTPGTFFEILVGSWLSVLLPQHQRSKFIRLPGNEESVSTDIVFSREGGPNFVFPSKITTRERIVQPFAHQRILNSVFGDGYYRSLLICMSETQRDDEDTSVNEICVPGTVRLFQKHLAELAGIFYLDPPQRYLQKNLTEIIEVNSIGALMTGRLAEMMEPPAINR
jgi:hypothetical protein